MRILINVDGFFSRDKINNKRQIELDIARGLAVVFMVLVHVQMAFTKQPIADSTFGSIIDFLGGPPAAPVFMFLMGVGFLYTRNDNWKSFVKRGIWILLLGYILNIARDTLPELLDYFLEHNPESLNTAIEGMIEIDILHFAGLSMICFGIFKRFKLEIKSMLLILLPIAVLNLVLQGVKVEGVFVKAITGLFWGSSELSAFPLFTWIFYPIIGYVFASFLIRCKNKKSFYKIILTYGTLLLIIITAISVLLLNSDLGGSSELSYYHHTITTNIVYSLFCVIWIALVYFISNVFPVFLNTQFKRWSKNVTEIYFIHWVLIGWLYCLLDESSLNIPEFLICSTLIFMVSDFVSIYLSKKNIKLG